MFNFNKYKNVFLFCLEGNIGASKTTLFNTLKKYLNFTNEGRIEIFFIDEPLNIWTEEYNEKIEGKTNPLKCQYNNPERFFQSFQCRVLFSYFDEFVKIYNKIKKDFYKNCLDCKAGYKMNEHSCDNNKIYVIISDRSPFTMKKVFYDGLVDKYNIRFWERDDYNKMYNYYFKDFFKLYGIIYINTPTYQCYLNKNKRCREGEEIISIEFLNLLDLYTNKFIDEFQGNPQKILYFNFKERIDETYLREDIEEIKQFILNFICKN